MKTRTLMQGVVLGDRDPEQMSYQSVVSEGDLLSFTATWPAHEEVYEENWSYFVLGKTEKGRETYRMGLGPVDDATCEKYVTVP